MELDKLTLAQIENAVSLLKSGNLVAFPTDTVYGLGGDALNSLAIANIYATKNRSTDKPLIVLLANTQQVKIWVREVTPYAQMLIDYFWPGPLTLIFPKATKVSKDLTAGRDTIGLRIPAHPIAQRLLTEFGGNGIATTSANLSGQMSLNKFEQVQAALNVNVALILAGECPVGIESTIVDVSVAEPCILRVGAISPEQVSHVLGFCVKIVQP